MRIIKSIFILSSVLFFITLATNARFSSEAKIQNNIFSTGVWTSSKIVINEVYYDPDRTISTKPDKAWIEIYNNQNISANIKNWQICNSVDCFVLHPQKEIPAFGFLLIAHDASALQPWTVSPDVEQVYYAGYPMGLRVSGDSVILKDQNGNVIDQMVYLQGAAQNNQSLERQPKGVGNFVTQNIPTPGF